MISSKKIKAFTLVEALTALLLMSLVFVLGWQAYILSAQQFELFRQGNLATIEQRQFIAIFERDVRAAQFIYEDRGALVLESFSGEQKRYQQESTDLVRKIVGREVEEEFAVIFPDCSLVYSRGRGSKEKLLESLSLQSQHLGLLKRVDKKYAAVDRINYRDRFR